MIAFGVSGAAAQKMAMRYLLPAARCVVFGGRFATPVGPSPSCSPPTPLPGPPWLSGAHANNVTRRQTKDM